MSPMRIIRISGLASGALLLAAAPVITPAATAATPVPDPVDSTQVRFYTPVGTADQPGTVNTTSDVHVVLGAGASVETIHLEYSIDAGETWQDLATSLARSEATGLFDFSWTPAVSGAVELRATGLAADVPVTGTPAEADVVLSSTSGTRFTLTQPTYGGREIRVGVFRRADGHSFAAISGTTTGTTAPTLADPAHDSLTASTLPLPTGEFDATAKSFVEPVDLGAYGVLTAASQVAVQVRDEVSSDAAAIAVYDQVVTAVRATTTPVAGTDTTEITATVTDQYGQPVTGVLMHLGGQAAGPVVRQNQTQVSDVRGQVSFSTGVTTPGGYDVYADLNLNTFHTTGEPGYQVILGKVAFAAPGKSFYHNNTRMKTAGGTVGDSLKGTRKAQRKGYTWIDQDGQLAFANASRKRAGAASVTSADQVVWVNAHGAPYNPAWLKKGRFEDKTWTALKKHEGLRNAEMTFQQNAAHGLSVEWEVKNIKPFTTQAALRAAFTNLAARAQAAYGSAWQSRVVVKVLSNVGGGQKYALKVLKAAHGQGFTTIFLARGATTKTQTIPAAAQQYVDYVRGASPAIYPDIPPASQFTAVTNAIAKIPSV
ncbi:hypothetical protein [Nocardioides sp.]|uniref:hypothetical protein n=1 Tax=Nocardioides sp. TaxID=35761 RepID=UPI0039E5DB52